MGDTFTTLLTQINELQITQKSIDFMEDLPDHLYAMLDNSDVKLVAEEVDVDERRWYESSISVFNVDGRYLGIRHVSKLYSEQSDVEDVFFTLKAMEMEPVQTVTYKPKQ